MLRKIAYISKFPFLIQDFPNSFFRLFGIFQTEYHFEVFYMYLGIHDMYYLESFQDTLKIYELKVQVPNFPAEQI